jgi:hypothetical protein
VREGGGTNEEVLHSFLHSRSFCVHPVLDLVRKVEHCRTSPSHAAAPTPGSCQLEGGGGTGQGGGGAAAAAAAAGPDQFF